MIIIPQLHCILIFCNLIGLIITIIMSVHVLINFRTLSVLVLQCDLAVPHNILNTIPVGK